RNLLFCQAEDGIRYELVTGVQTCALPILIPWSPAPPTSTPCPISPAWRERNCVTCTPSALNDSFGSAYPISRIAWRATASKSTEIEERRVGKEWRDRGASCG